MKLVVAILSLLAWSAPAAFLMPSNPIPVVTLGWDVHTDLSVTGYALYFGVGPRAYTNQVPVNGRSNNTVTVSNLVRGATYYFAVTAKNNVGLESDFSDEVSYAVPAPPVKPSVRPIAVMVVEAKQNLDEPLWFSDLSFPTMPIEPDGEKKFYRLRIEDGRTSDNE